MFKKKKKKKELVCNTQKNKENKSKMHVGC